jgi:hypothetical protein
MTMAVVLAGCPKTDGAAGSADGGSVGTAATPGTAAASASPSAAAVAVDASAFTGAFKGTLDGKHALVVHLVNTGGTLDGSYYYVPSIEDLKLHGTVSAVGVVHLDESSKGKPTGAFDGHLGPGGVFDGTWTSPDRSKSFAAHLDPVHATSGTATLAERKKKSKSKPTKPFDKTMWATEAVCDVDIAYPDLLGSVSPPAAELKLDQELQKSAVADLDACEAPFTLQESYKVITNGSGVLSVEQSENQFAFGAAHPNYGVVTRNFALPSGKPIALSDLVTPAAMTLIKERIVAGLGPDVDADVKKQVVDGLATSPPDFSLDRNGLKVSVFSSLPHAYQGAGVEGASISKKDLAPFRKKPSPVDALWGS